MYRSTGSNLERISRIKESLGVTIDLQIDKLISCTRLTTQRFRSILQKGRLTYESSGVSIDAGDHLVSAIKPATCSTKRAGTLGAIGGFGGLFDVKAAGYNDPILVSGTDGVGTKLKVNIKKIVRVDLSCLRAAISSFR